MVTSVVAAATFIRLTAPPFFFCCDPIPSGGGKERTLATAKAAQQVTDWRGFYGSQVGQPESSRLLLLSRSLFGGAMGFVDLEGDKNGKLVGRATARILIASL
jgi:hypothetical protein